MLKIILLQIFWFSFSLIGFAVLLCVARIAVHKGKKLPLTTFIKQCHWIVAYLICSSVGLVVFVPFMTVAYIFELPILFIATVYFSLLIITAFTAFIHRRMLAGYVSRRWKALTKPQLLTGILAWLGLGIVYVIALRIGGSFLDDSPVHIAHIQLFLVSGHYTFADPFLGYNGIIDARYSANLLNGLQGLGGYLFHLPAYKVWFYSYAAYYPLLMAGIFSVIRTFVKPGHLPNTSLYASVLLLPFFGYNYTFQYIELPHSIVFAWLALFTLGVKRVIEVKKSDLLIISAVLIAMTHSLSAFIVLVFVALLLFALFVTKNLRRETVKALLVAGIILAIPVSVNSLLPSRSTELSLKEKHAIGLQGNHFEIKHFGPIVVPKFDLRKNTEYHSSDMLDVQALSVYGVLLLLVLVCRRAGSKLLKRILLILVMLAGLLVFNMQYLSLVTYALIIIKSESKVLKLLTSLIVLFYFLIACNPFILTFTEGHVPLWLIARFHDFNMFALIAPLLGLFIMYRYLAQKMGLSTRFTATVCLLLIFAVTSLPLYRFPLNVGDIRYFGSGRRDVNMITYQQVEQLQKIEPYIRNQIIASNDAIVTAFLAITVKKPTYGQVYNIQSNQMQDYVRRLQCQDKLWENLDLSDLQAAKVTRFIISSGSDAEPGTQQLSKLADKKLYLKQMAKVDQYKIYEVRKLPADKKVESICSFKYKQ